ncbi:type II toxin-antitoxin system RelE/ParE family toxin [Hespellia stercorisuis]|uniref:ParE toxin of type II toxin-antitoxin system, parDE n=1 Tax=Hespellia stercorisuis DSM 15480 TaxID=1121950 RepID=A0A1M6TKG9_9FIRM|nr:type II toxin-antitoxin system RelE/ParE family toxin [Hespellia stercorisuis]SHK57420.1 ParE toxin of type II toxin-antitoxin system, parDE [Hespellia stercorisuis DSM 15480]
MASNKYMLQYLPLFYEDLEEKLNYINYKLKNPQAANELLDAVESAIMERLPFAESFEQYNSLHEREYPYYRIYVNNYTIYYVVLTNGDQKIMEVRRFLYNKQNTKTLV